VFCPYCDRELNAHSPALGERPPSKGDASVCIYCGGVAIFGKKGLRKPTPLERDDAYERKDVRLIVVNVVRFINMDERDPRGREGFFVAPCGCECWRDVVRGIKYFTVSACNREGCFILPEAIHMTRAEGRPVTFMRDLDEFLRFKKADLN
jgi:hypothetical protein